MDLQAKLENLMQKHKVNDAKEAVDYLVEIRDKLQWVTEDPLG